jgi:hypothetical protein
MHEPIQNTVSHRRISDLGVPLRHRQLAGQQCRLSQVSLIAYLQKGAASAVPGGRLTYVESPRYKPSACIFRRAGNSAIDLLPTSFWYPTDILLTPLIFGPCLCIVKYM